MSTERKPEQTGDWSHQEKQTMSQPQEEFIGDEAQPSKDISEVRDEEVTDVKPAGHQDKPKDHVFEPGVEG